MLSSSLKQGSRVLLIGTLGVFLIPPLWCQQKVVYEVTGDITTYLSPLNAPLINGKIDPSNIFEDSEFVRPITVRAQNPRDAIRSPLQTSPLPHQYSQDKPSNPPSVIPIADTFRTGIEKEKKMVGDYTLSLLQNQTLQGADKMMSRRFIHALNMSDWIEAAELLPKTFSAEQLHKIDQIPELSWLVMDLKGIDDSLTTLSQDKRAFSEVNDITLTKNLKKEVRSGYDMWWAYGKLPKISKHENTPTSDPSSKTTPPIPPSMTQTIHMLDKSRETFSQLDLWNNLYQPLATTREGGLVGLGQDHYWAYFHWKRAEEQHKIPTADIKSSLRKPKKTILVHWDAHADLYSNLEFEDAKNWRDAVHGDLSSLAKTVPPMTIDGFIVPAIAEGLVDEVYLVVPEEAHHAMGLPYRTYILATGINDSGNSVTITTKSNPVNFADVVFTDGALGEHNVRREIQMHVVTPGQMANQIKIRKQDKVIMDVDVDYLGTVDPLARKELPTYRPNSSRYQQLMRALGQFYTRFKNQIGSVSIARSPDFSWLLKTRHPPADVLKILFPNPKSAPAWVQEEIALNP